jgi:hypothetical protein
VKVLKRHAQLAVTLAPKMRRRSMLLDDLVGMTFAGLAMGFALVTMWLAFKHSTQYGAIYVAIYIIGYMFKVLLLALRPARPWVLVSMEGVHKHSLQ